MSADKQDVRAGAFMVGNTQAIPLEGVTVEARVQGFASRVVLRQRYRNTEPVPVEAVYVFPLPESAAVCGLVLETGGRRIVGRVLDREKAFDRYDDALAAGHGAVLLDHERPNVFTASVGNLLPGQELTVELTWVAELGWEGEAERFLLPTTVAPRYVPPEDARGVSPTPGERVTPPVALDVPYGFSFQADIELPGGVAAVESPSHPIRVTLDGDRARVALSREVAAMDRDLVLLLTPRAARTPWVQLERHPDGPVTAAVSFVPRLERDSRTPREVVFLVDRSGSMEGSSIAEVRRALQLCLRSLREGDRFDIVGFGSRFSALFGTSRRYGDDTLEAASRHVDTVQADLGGTAILPALCSVLEQPRAEGARREVILLTDGEVSNEEAVIALAGEHREHTRIFTFGIGSGASEYLVNALARATGGAAEMIHPGERIEPKVLRQFGRIGTPALHDLQLDWGAPVERQAPHRLARVFDGEPLLVYTRLQGEAPDVVRLEGRTASGPVRWELPLDGSAAREGTLLATLAARAAIRDLEEGTSALHERSGSRQEPRVAQRVRKEIVALGVQYGLASSATSFVAVEERPAGEARRPAELRRIPVALTHGWGGVVRDEAPTARFQRSRRSPAPAMVGQAQVMDAESYVLPCFCETSEPSFMQAAAPRRPLPSRPAPPPQRPHDTLVRLQRADGSWRLDAALAQALGLALADLRAAASSLTGLRHAEELLATAAALRALRARAAAFEDEWRLLAEKAERWITGELAATRTATRETLESLVARLLPG